MGRITGGTAAGGSIGITLVRIVFSLVGIVFSLVRIVFPLPHPQHVYQVSHESGAASLQQHSFPVHGTTSAFLAEYEDQVNFFVRFIASGGIMIVVAPWLLVAGRGVTHSDEAEAEAHLEV